MLSAFHYQVKHITPEVYKCNICNENFFKHLVMLNLSLRYVDCYYNEVSHFDSSSLITVCILFSFLKRQTYFISQPDTVF